MCESEICQQLLIDVSSGNYCEKNYQFIDNISYVQ